MYHNNRYAIICFVRGSRVVIVYSCSLFFGISLQLMILSMHHDRFTAIDQNAVTRMASQEIQSTKPSTTARACVRIAVAVCCLAEAPALVRL